VIGPHLVGAQARSLRTVLVSFDGPVRQAGDGDPKDALTPSNYSLVPLTTPAMPVEVAAIAPVSPSAVTLSLDADLSPRATYAVVARALCDLDGNLVAPGSVSFSGFAPNAPAARRFEIYQLFPRMNRDEDEGDLERLTSVLQDVTDLLLADVDRFPMILDPDLAPQPFLGRMLQDLGNPFPFDLTDLEQRRLLSILVPLYREKGTEQGVRDALRFFLGIEAQAIDAYHESTLVLGESLLGVNWELGPSDEFDLYAFDVVVSRALTDAERQRIRLLVNYLKPAHTHFVNLREPVIPAPYDPVELGLSHLGVDWTVH
jgi:phage tail-like protein